MLFELVERRRRAASRSPAATATCTSAGSSSARASGLRLVAEQPVMIAGGRVDAALGEAEQGEPGALLAADLRRGRTPPRPRRGRRAGAGCRRPRRSRRRCWRRGAVELVARPSRLALGLGQSPAPLQHDGAVHAADAGEDGERVLLGPALRRLGPLGGAVESPSSSQAPIRLQYTLPVEYGPRRPSTAKSIASSRWPMPVGDVALVDQDAARWSAAPRPRGRPTAARRPRSSGLAWPARARASSSPAPWAVSASRSRRAPYATHSGSPSERPAGPPQPAAGDRRAGVERVVLPQPHRALAGRGVVARASS